MANAKGQSGYSGTPLLKKLGYKASQRALFLALPEPLVWLADFPGFQAVKSLKVLRAPSSQTFDLIHLFETDAERLEATLPRLRRSLADTGMLWVSWPKKASKVPSSLTEDRVRDLALANGLVDIKVCALDAVWSGLKLVVPVKDRAPGRGSQSAP